MAEYREYTAKTVDEAITKACVDLGVTSDKLDYDVTQEASAGFLGLGAKQAVIRARARTEEELKAEQAAILAAEQTEKKSVVTSAPEEKESSEDKTEETGAGEAGGVITSDEIEKRAAAAAAKAKAEGREIPADGERSGRTSSGRRDGTGRGGRGRRSEDRGRRSGRSERSREENVRYEYHEPSKPKPERVVKARTEEEAAALEKAAEDFLRSVFAAMNMEVTIETSYDQKEGCVSCVFSGDEMGILIGKRGQTLDSLQYLTSLVVNKNTDEYVRVKLDTEDYRARRADTLGNLARNIAYKVRKTHRPVSLEPMNPYERRIIHSALQGNKYVETYSEGEEPYRHVVVAPKR